jgi:signal transduction histidine kinase
MQKGEMSLRLRIFAKDFGRRLCASLGVGEALRTEEWLCAVRVVLALYCYFWVKLGTAEWTLQPWQALLNSYVLYSFLIFVLLRLHGAADSAYRLTTLVVDFFFAGTVTILTGGPESACGVLWVFVVMTTACRWGLRETNLTTVACTLLLIIEVIVFRLWPQHFKALGEGDHTIDRLLLRGTCLVVISLLLGSGVVRERRLRAESALVARVLGHAVDPKMDLALGALFAEITPLYVPRKALVALRKGNLEEIFCWETERPLTKSQVGVVRTALQFSKLEAAAFSCPAHTWYFDRSLRQSGRGPRILALDVFGRRVGFLDSKDWHSCLPADEVPSLMVSSFSFEQALEGRLILVGPSLCSESKEALRFLHSLVKQIGPVIQNIYVMRDTRTQLEDQVRAALTRELHDGILQSLLGAEMQIEVLRRPCANASGESERLAALQALIHQEALNLRDLIEKTKPLNFSPKELPDFLAELVAKFRLETGISARLETGEKNITLPSSVCHEIVRIVQEGLSNVRKHSGARNVLITLSEDDVGQRKLLIADDGRGFEFRGRATHTQLDASHRGPGVIKERVRLIGGELTIDSSPGNWARLEITIPDELHG